MRRISNFVVLLPAFIIIVSCTSNSLPPATSLTQLEIPIYEVRPDFIEIVSPPEYSIVPLEVYRYLPENSIWLGIENGTDEYYNSSICVRLHARLLVQEGDNLLDEVLMWERMQLSINDAPMEHYNHISGGLPASYPGPYGQGTTWIERGDYCWKAPVGEGLHKVTFQFRQTSGDVQSYTWYFQITE